MKMEFNGIEYEVSYRRVRYARVELKTGKLFLVLPPGNDPQTLLEKHKNWISRKKKFFEECRRDSAGKQISNRTEAEFREVVSALVSRYARELGVTVNKVSFRKMKTKWGACFPARKNIIFNYTIRYLPDRLLEYIVFHEVAHLRERKHNRIFWNLIVEKFNDRQGFEKELISYLFKIREQSAESK